MILAKLRDETAPLHERVERAVNLPARLVSADAYAALLARFLGFYAPLERRLAEVPGLEMVGLNLAERAKAPLLGEDLLALGFSPDAVSALPTCPGLPSVSTPAQALGSLYVVEGATLGGQYVRREVAKRYGFAPGSGCSFFASYGERVGAMWKEFCGVLSAYADAHPGAEAPIVSAAAETFIRFEEWVA
jgi:heme oxygenase